MYAETTITTPSQGWIRRAMAVLALAIALSGVTAVSGAQPAEAATRAYHPTAVCSSINGNYGSVRVGHGLTVSGYGAEQVAVSYTIQRWNGSTRSWYNYLRHSYAATVYPTSQATVELPPTHTVHSGFYRVWLGLAWYENGVKKSWSGWVPIYNGAWASHCRA